MIRLSEPAGRQDFEKRLIDADHSRGGEDSSQFEEILSPTYVERAKPHMNRDGNDDDFTIACSLCKNKRYRLDKTCIQAVQL